MDRQEKHRQQKDKQRDQKNKDEQAYEDANEQRRLPVRSAWLIVAGIVLTALALYLWTFGLVRPW